MRLLRNLAVPLVLCLILGATPASAQEERPSASRVGSIVDRIQAFLTAVWEQEAGEIDPWGRNSPGDEPATPGTDEGWQIDPWG